ncbi:tyrosinase family protein [Mesorhizobium sp. M1365]|uniref:tyrosinase family protein n=1 Tax=Mesorhizobium sp. M1365 TaxID=2957090 RepID=UPI003335C9E0
MAVRRDVAALGAGWNPTLEWYARAVAAMSARPVTDRTSWRYLAAIHGISDFGDGDPSNWRGQGIIGPTEDVPPPGERRRIWDQCQHQTWYFLPWHRGYLWAFEAIVAKTIAEIGGPDGWALPYWNYLDTSNPDARRIPQAFLDPLTPSGQPNFLSAPPRHGLTVLGPVPGTISDITLASMKQSRFTAAPGTLAFGGAATPFWHSGGGGSGAVELNPHNNVHLMVGGLITPGGFMTDPNFAALDPIFWLHHCNIDRLWEAWLGRTGNVQENGAAWSGGPAPRSFEMPDAAGSLATFTPADTLPGKRLAPTYDEVTIGTGAPAVIAAAGAGGGQMPATFSNAPPPASQVIGSSGGQLKVGAAPNSTTVVLTQQGAQIAAGPVQQRLFLNLENIRGTTTSGVLRVYLGMPATAGHPSIAPIEVESVALFGLAKASKSNGAHAGNGLGVSIDITDAARALMLEAQTGLDRLEVRVEQPAAANRSEISVDNVTVVSQPFE